MKAKRAQRTVAGVLFITLLLCTVYALIRFLLTSDAPPGDPHGKLKSDYLLMLVQCCLGLVVMTLPTVFSRKLRLMVPGVMCILYYVFLYAAIILGEILSFYHLFPGIWDSVLHAFRIAFSLITKACEQFVKMFNSRFSASDNYASAKRLFFHPVGA